MKKEFMEYLKANGFVAVLHWESSDRKAGGVGFLRNDCSIWGQRNDNEPTTVDLEYGLTPIRDLSSWKVVDVDATLCW
jgi:hypothetical protein